MTAFIELDDLEGDSAMVNVAAISSYDPLTNPPRTRVRMMNSDVMIVQQSVAQINELIEEVVQGRV